MDVEKPLTRVQIRNILVRNRGSQVAIARALGLKPPAINRWLKGQDKSRRVEAACRAKAEQLLLQEEVQARCAA